MKTKLQIKSVFGCILFEYESENNTLKKTIEEAVKRGANLKDANLKDAYLKDANLYGANLYGANLKDAYLYGAYLEGAKDVPFIPLNLPEGEFIAYKKVYDGVDYIVKLKILEDSKRSRATSDKCRCDKALVLEIQDIEGNELDVTEITNISYADCTYKVGEVVEADSWDEDRFNECSHGIHFFLDRQSAVNY